MPNCTNSRGWIARERAWISHRHGIARGEDRGGSRAAANRANYASNRDEDPRASADFPLRPRRLKIIARGLPDWRLNNGIERRSPLDLPRSRCFIATLPRYPPFFCTGVISLRSSVISEGEEIAGWTGFRKPANASEIVERSWNFCCFGVNV